MNRALNYMRYLSYSLIAFISIANIVIYFTHNMQMDVFFNADALYLPSLYKDIVINNGNYANWFLTPAPYFFPDIPLYFIANYLMGNFYYAIPFFFTLEAILFILIIYKLYSIFIDKEQVIYSIAIILALLYLFPTSVSVLQLVGGFHYGEFLIGIYTIYLLLKVIESTKTDKLSLLFFIILASLLLASDDLYLVHYLIPFFFSSILLWAIGKLNKNKLILILILLGTSIVVGKGIHNLLVVNERAYTQSIIAEKLFQNTKVIVDIFSGPSAYEHEHKSIIFSVILFITGLLVLVFKSKLAKICKCENVNTKILFITLFFISMMVTSLLVFSSVTLVITTRYMIPLFILPIILSPIYINYLSPFSNKEMVNKLMFLFILLLCFLVIKQTQTNLVTTDIKKDYTTPFIQCFDSFVKETGAQKGISEYWQAKRIYMLSKQPVTIAHVIPTLEPFYWITTKEWYLEKYDFAIIHHGVTKDRKLHKDKIISINGKADKTFKCGKVEIIYYKNGMKTST